ncbi:DUF4258 domain-containing protein [Halomonas dongshanensis]|uniref:DUF4258 domain-containing protein n=1 Tax=Halomonas dongshanensis TaxID=2890835 RepID=A0ABT2EC25_9GAMM|nr:DUF4258 domain-containing protein [Halomonas dongshanensis]MCS2609132.1 DUF4258 domain-containing protein [Halomonas dongshanensis]
MYSPRFEKYIHVTRHARERMASRNVSEDELAILIEKGALKYKDATRLWAAHHFGNRSDNLVSVAAIIEDKLVVKTVMHYFHWEGE